MKEDNLFATEADVTEFLKSRSTRTEWKTDYGITSLLTFPYATPEVRMLACAAITAYLEDRLRYWNSQSELNRYILRIAPFLEAAGYTPAIEPLMRLRNMLEAEDYRPGSYGYQFTVAVQNAIETLQRVHNSRPDLEI